MKYTERRVKRNDLTKEILFDFGNENTRVEGDSLFLKIKKTTIPVEVGSKITFNKVLHYSSDGTEEIIQKSFSVLSVKDGVVEIENPSVNRLWCIDAMEYSMYDKEMDDSAMGEFNYLPKDYTTDYNYFVLEFENGHYINIGDKFNLRLRKTSPWAENGFVYCDTDKDLPQEGNEYTVYVVKYEGNDIEIKNTHKIWDVDGKKYTPVSEEQVNKLLKDTEKNGFETHFYKRYGMEIDNHKLQIVIPTDDYYDWVYDLTLSKIDVIYDINGKIYDDRIFFKECDNKVMLSENVTSTIASNFLRFNVQLSESHGTNLFQETILKSEYVDDVIGSAIPEINDYEKTIIKPYIQRGSDKYERATRLIFNLHFRDRMNGDIVSDNWTTDDSKFWNGDYENNIDKSDLLWYLGFDKDDVYYQKMKLQKSFLRLSFYDSDDPMNQNLLFYSTIFIDTGDLFGKYNKLKTSAIDGELNGYDSEKDIMTADVNGFPRLSSQFIVTDKFNNDKSSEGFYIYLFNKTLPKKVAETIYMKVEFNHAKYGKTIPFLYFTDTSNNPSNSIKKTYLITENGGKKIDMKSYFKDLYIEMRVQYDENTRSYMYYLPYNNSSDNSDIIFNLFEPKING
jgi:hypothetical protein